MTVQRVSWLPSLSMEVVGVSLKLAQVVVQGLDVGEHTHGVGFVAHDHHVIHLNEAVAARLCSGDGK